MSDTSSISRRDVLKGLAAGAVAAPFIARPAIGAPTPIKIGLVAPQTGPLALFSQELPYVLDSIKKSTGGVLRIGGTAHPYEILLRDSQSSSNRASQVAQDLILNEKVTIVTAFATPETVNPVADQCELNGMPCLTNDAPLESYFFQRKGDPKKGFEWTYHFFFNAVDVFTNFLGYWGKLNTNKVIGVLFANDGDGIALSNVLFPMAKKAGFKIVDPGRFDMPSNYNAQLSAFKAAGAQIVTGTIPPPEFTTFWNNAAQQKFRPKAVSVGKATEFPAAVSPFGARADGLTVETWWSPAYPFSSGLTHQTSRELANAYEKATGRQWTMTLGHRHALIETVFDVLRRAQTLDKPESVRDAIAATNYKSIVGTIDFKTGPLPNCSKTPLVLGQWQKGKKYPLDLIVCGNTAAPQIPVETKPMAITYT